MAGERGAADAERDIRGFAVKFYTEEGNWDLVPYAPLLCIPREVSMWSQSQSDTLHPT